MRLFALAAVLCAAPLMAQSNCTYVLTPTIQAAPAGGYTGVIQVTQTAGSSCPAFSATVNVTWIHLLDVRGTVPGQVSYQVDANTTANPRTGIISMALTQVTITQAGANCAFSIVPKSQSFSVDGASSTFGVQANCAWQALSNADWIQFPGTQGGTSDGTVNFTVVGNSCVASRTGSITVATTLANPPVFAVTQDGSPNNLTLSATALTLGAAASDQRVTVNTGQTCAWSAFSNVSWMTINSGAGTGNGAIVFHLVENKGGARTGTIQVGSTNLVVTQQGPAPPPVVLNAVTNAASYSPDAVAPGEIVTLFGSNLGPASIATLQLVDGKLTNTLAATQVFFDDLPAPLVYTVAGQVSAVVPYGVVGKKATKAMVQYQGASSNTITMAVQPSLPGIFTLDASGVGPGAILNQDNTVNASGNPAAKGSIISIYMTGAGETNPASVEGAVTSGTPLLKLPVVVTIGGVQATNVTYAGGAPGAIVGLTQVNVQVPAGAPAGNGIPVVVKVGDVASPAAATMSVK